MSATVSSRARCPCRTRRTAGYSAWNCSARRRARSSCRSSWHAPRRDAGWWSGRIWRASPIRRRRARVDPRGNSRRWPRVHLLSQLHQDAGRRLRMHERDTPAAGAAPWHLVDETVPRRPAALERLVQIRHAVADMMDARPTLGEELRHRAVRVAGLEELDLNVAQRQADDGRTVGRLGAPRLEAEHVAIEAEGGVDGRNGDADVGDAGA